MVHQRKLGEVAQHQNGVVTRAQALQAGYSDSALVRLCRSGEWAVLHPGVYRLPGATQSWEQSVMAAVLYGGQGAVASHRSAGSLLALPNVVRRLEVTIPQQRRVRSDRIEVHRCRSLASEDLRAIRDIPATAPARTVIDLATVYGRERIGDILDEAAARRLLRRKELEDAFARLGPLPKGDPRWMVRSLLDQRPDGRGPESRIERRLLDGIRAAGLPMPVVQYVLWVPDGQGGFRERRLDLAWPDLRDKLGVEVISFRWHGDLKSWSEDAGREAEIVAMGWSILSTTSYRITYLLAAVIAQIARALAARGVAAVPDTLQPHGTLQDGASQAG